MTAAQRPTIELAPWAGRRTHEVVAALEGAGIAVTVEEESVVPRVFVGLLRPPPAAHRGDHVVASAYGGRVVRLRVADVGGPAPGGLQAAAAALRRLGALEARVDALEADVAKLSKPEARPPAKKTTANKTPAKKAPVKKAAAKKAPAKRRSQEGGG